MGDKPISVQIDKEKTGKELQAGQKIESAKVKKILQDMKVFDFIESEYTEMWKLRIVLIIATLSNTVAFGWRDAARNTLSYIKSDGVSSTVSFVYAASMTLIGIYVVVRLNQFLERKQALLIDHIWKKNEESTEESVRKQLLAHEFRKRMIKLSDSSIKFAIAWAWRDSINAFLRAVYGEDGVWSYTIILTLFVSACYAVAADYYIIYPKNKKEQQTFFKSKSRNIGNKMIYDNLRFVVGLSWFDSINHTVGFTDSDYVAANPVNLAVGYWLIAIVGVCASLIGTKQCKKHELVKLIQDKGLAQAMFDTFESFYDPKGQFHDADSDMVPKIMDNMAWQALNVTVGAWGVTGALAIRNAILWTVSASLVKGAIIEDASKANRSSVWVLWLSTAICLVITIFGTTWVGKLVEGIKVARRELFDKMKMDKQAQLNRLQADDHEDEDQLAVAKECKGNDEIVYFYFIILVCFVLNVSLCRFVKNWYILHCYFV